MTIRLDEHPDGGCWISDDRLNAFISAQGHGIAEIGFHGLQPVSKNSRMLSRPEGVLSVSVGREHETAFTFSTVEWSPHCVQTSILEGEQESCLAITAAGRSLRMVLTGPPGGNARVTIRFSLRSLFTEVHGNRSWGKPEIRDRRLFLHCRDRIVLREWLSRTGPYAGDFLIPEPWRRIIFTRQCKSGLATLEDIRPEYRESEIALYDAETWIRMGGDQFAATLKNDIVTFSSRPSGENELRAMFMLECAEDRALFDDVSNHSREAVDIRPFKNSLPLIPELDLPGHRPVETFFTTVPAIVRSCTVRDIGMTRATPGAYYWIWAWDNLVTALEMSGWNETFTAGRVVRFINSHRDVDQSIPGRWTRSYQPLDTPPSGALEFLLLLLASHNAIETGEKRDLLDVYPYSVRHLRKVACRSNSHGLAGNSGFYPDFPQRFGRSEQSATAMETGATYAFCRLLEVAARETGDHATVAQAEELAGRICSSFESTFWDNAKGFLRDSVDLESGVVNATYPLFSLLFLQTPLALRLIRPFLVPMARFAREHLQTPNGTRLIPGWDTRKDNEAALSSWYPHWDVYLLKLLRRAGDRDGIIIWLRAMEQVLNRLGYAPEFLALDGFAPDDPTAWKQHGAVSNLNCATGWYRSIVEGLFGIEFDPGGMTILPLALPLGTMTLRRLVHRQSQWEIRIENGGSSLDTILIDGKPLRGCTKIPSRYHDGHPHRLEIIYGSKDTSPLFTEVINAEILESSGNDFHAAISVRALGNLDVAFPLTSPSKLSVDGVVVPFTRDTYINLGFAELSIYGTHELSLTRID